MKGLATATAALASSALVSKPLSARTTSVNTSMSNVSATPTISTPLVKRQQVVTVTAYPPVPTTPNPIPGVAGLTYKCTESRFPVDITYTAASKPTVTLTKPGGGTIAVTIDVPQETVVRKEAKADICVWRATSGPNKHVQRARTHGKPLGGLRIPFVRKG